MRTNGELELLFRRASEYEFDEFIERFSELEAGRPLEDIWEAYLMRAQIKLYAADDTLWDDLRKIARFDGRPAFPLLGGLWLADAPNQFIVFSRAPGALEGFYRKLPSALQEFSRWYGEQGGLMVRQIQGDILYFLDDPGAALEVAEELHRSACLNRTDAILAQCLRFRCYLALCLPQQAEECMLDMVRLSQTYPECQPVYRALRTWANLTTNWNGDNRRFYNDSNGRRRPVLDDRLEGVRRGTSKTTPLEKPFIGYAEQSDEYAYAIRQYYMDLLHAMYWFEVDDPQQTESYFRKLYQVAFDSGVCMPLVECGEQITPLLRHVRDQGWDCSRQWLDRLIARAGQYEKSLNAYKDLDT